jgi:hypothetical protein
MIVRLTNQMYHAAQGLQRLSYPVADVFTERSRAL